MNQPTSIRYNNYGKLYIPRDIRHKIYARDDWRCMMPRCFCPEGRDIDPKLFGKNENWAPSVDHLIPKVYGGADDERNFRAAHRYCNAATMKR